MRAQTLSEINEIVETIYTGNFTIRDIKTLFSNIRFHVKSYLKDVADFVGHPDERDQGVAVMIAKTTAYGFYHIKETNIKKIDLNGEFPSYFKTFLLLNLHNLSDKQIKDHCGKSKAQLKDDIENRIDINQDKKTAKLWMDDLEHNNFPEQADAINKGIEYVAGRLIVKELKQNEIFGALSSYLNSIIPNFKKDVFLKQKNKIILYILTIMHNTVINMDLDIPAYFCIGLGLYLKENEEGKFEFDGTETLNINFHQGPIDNLRGWACHILLTDLKTIDWVEDSLLQLCISKGELFISIPVKINGNFKLEAA